MDLDSFLLAADTTRMQAGGRSIFEKAGDALTAGAAGAVVSGLTGIYNTGAWYANKLFDAGIKEADTSRVLRNIDTNWSRYYDEHKDVIDTVGFIGGAFIPGTLAIKGLQMARAGKAVGTFGRVLGYTANRQEEFLRKGLQELAQEGGTVFARLNSNKLLSMSFGAADNVLQTAAFETAAALSMHQSPFFEGDTWGDMSWDIVKTSLAGGLLGGAVESFFTNRIFKDAGKAVEKTSRKYDTIASLEKMGMTYGDEAFSWINGLEDLPRQVLETDKKLPFSYVINGKSHSIELDVSQLLDKKLGETTKKTLEKFKEKLTNVVKADPTVGSPLAAAFSQMYQEGVSANVSSKVIRSELGNYLFGLQRVEGLGAARVNLNDEVWFFTPLDKAAKETSDFAKFFSLKKVSDKSKPYRIVGNPAEAKHGVIGLDAPTFKQAWKDGFDVLMDEHGNFHFNPQSAIFRPASGPDETEIKSIFNIRTKQMSDTAVGTVADIATAEKPLTVTTAGVVSGDKIFKFSVGYAPTEVDTVEATARHLWASQFTRPDSLGDVIISSRDVSMLDAIRQNPTIVSMETKLRLRDGSIEPLKGFKDFNNWYVNNKISMAIEMLAGDDYNISVADLIKKASKMDLRDVAYKLNVEPSWLQEAIAMEFRNDALKLDTIARELKSYAARENLVFTYDKAIKQVVEEGKNDFVTGLLNYNYRRGLAIDKANEAVAAVLKRDYEKLLDFDYELLHQKFNQAGSVGATGAGFSNADYGDLARLWAQDTGKNVNLIKQRRINAVLDQLQPHTLAILGDEAAGNELATVLTKARRSDYSLSLMDGRLVDLASKRKYLAAINSGDTKAAQEVSFGTNIPLNPKVYNFLEIHHKIHQEQLASRKILANAQGTVLHWEDDALYLPPIDTRKVPYFAFVRQADGRALGTSEVAMITARTPEELQRLAAQVGPDYEVIFKSDTELYHKALGDYEYSRALNKPTIDPFLRKQGKLGDFLPSFEPKATVEDFIHYHQKKETQLTRDAVEVKYGQVFNELRWLSEQNTKITTSKFEWLGKLQQKAIKDPFGDYAKTALDISKRSEFTLWHQANEFVDALGTRAYQATEKAFQDAKQGKITWEEANSLMEKFGLGGPFTSQEAFLTAQVGNDRNLIKQAVAKGNLLLSTFALRFDFAQSLINIISTPVLLGTEVSSIRRSIAKDPELVGKLNELMNVTDPINKVGVPSTSKLLYNSVRNFWTPEGKALLNGRYKDIGAVKDVLSQYHQMIEDLSITPNLAPKQWAKKASEWTEKISTLTGNNFAEDFTRFVSADVMRQLTDPLVSAGKMGQREQNAFISIFVNRVQGNYIASQRPIMFQGTIGSAIGLFQTYQFNLFQQLFRHIEARDARTVAVMAGLQGSIFGLNGLPLFDAINTYLIGQANINEGHRDAYSFAVEALGKEWGDWALYGTASAFPIFSDKMPSLYTRGDLNPRHVSIVPTSFSQIPAVEASTRIVKSLLGMGKQIGNNADLGSTLLFGLEHNGINRPLAGIAQVLQGESTTSTGSLISVNSDFSSIATASRILGAKPLDESIALNAKFRMESYRAADRLRIEELGTAVKDKIRNGTLTPEDIEDFAARYAQVGGRIEQFGAALQRWSKQANQSIVNVIMQGQRTQYSRRMMEIMGADPLDDMYSQGE